MRVLSSFGVSDDDNPARDEVIRDGARAQRGNRAGVRATTIPSTTMVKGVPTRA